MKYPDTGKPAPTPETDNAMNQMLCFSDHPAVECLSDLSRKLELQRDALEAALRELVELKDLKERDVVFDGDAYQDYAKRKPLAWEAARAALSLVEKVEIVNGPSISESEDARRAP